MTLEEFEKQLEEINKQLEEEVDFAKWLKLLKKKYQLYAYLCRKAGNENV